MSKIEEKIKYGYGDITINPAKLTRAEHRGDCNPYIDGKFNLLPIFTAPMSQIVDCDNMDFFSNCGVEPILPRNIDFNKRIEKLNDGWWVAFGLDEMNRIIENFDGLINPDNPYNMVNICLDLANGHMKKVITVCEDFKNKCRHTNVQCKVMTGNIANPEWVKMMNDLYTTETTPIDYIRCGIGGGSMCFVAGTKITLSDGTTKNIEEVNIGDVVKTKNGNFKVISENSKQTETIVEINKEIKCTENHEFFVVNKSDAEKVNDNNLDEYGFWVEASKLDKTKHFLVKMS